MTKEVLQKGAEMFIYLTTCSEPVKSWFFFYENLFAEKSPAQIILAMNRVLKGTKTPENMDMKTLADNFFGKFESYLSLK